MTAPELKPCPFCGGEAKRRTLPSDEFGNDGVPALLDALAAAEARAADLTAKLELANYVLQDDLNNRLTPRVVDIAYTAWQLGRSGVNKDDGGPCDWFNDTRPKVMDCIASIRAAIKAGGAA